MAARGHNLTGDSRGGLFTLIISPSTLLSAENTFPCIFPPQQQPSVFLLCSVSVFTSFLRTQAISFIFFLFEGEGLSFSLLFLSRGLLAFIAPSLLISGAFYCAGALWAGAIFGIVLRAALPFPGTPQVFSSWINGET